MVMCFFILWMSFHANVTENAWEFGVLRSLGLHKGHITMVYVYESLALVKIGTIFTLKKQLLLGEIFVCRCNNIFSPHYVLPSSQYDMV